MKNNKGFTLVELLAVIVLLGIVALISVPVINDKIDEAKTKSYDAQITNILDAAKDYALEEIIGYPTKKQNYDIIFILDTSGSMNGDCTNPETTLSLNRLKNSVSAVNEIMQRYMVDSNNRVGIVTFNGSVSTLLPLDHYTSTTGNYIETLVSHTSTDDPYYISDDCIKPPSDDEKRLTYYNIYRQYKLSDGVYNSKGELMNSDVHETDYGTNSQVAIYKGLTMLLDNESTNIPVVFFITDGIPSHKVYTSYITPDNDHKTSENVVYTNMYNTVLTAMYYKNYIFSTQGRMPRIYSIGLDVVTVRGTAFLNPIKENLMSTSETVVKFKELLESDDNPYKDNYMYVDGAYLGSNLSVSDIKENINDSITKASESYIFTIQDLIDKGYLKEDALNDPRTGGTLDGYISVKYVRKSDNNIVCFSDDSTDLCEYKYEFVDNSLIVNKDVD